MELAELLTELACWGGRDFAKEEQRTSARRYVITKTVNSWEGVHTCSRNSVLTTSRRIADTSVSRRWC